MKENREEGPSMEKVKALFEKSGLTMNGLGLKMGYPPETARQSVFQFLKASDPHISMLIRFAKAVNVPLPEITGYGHDSRILPSGESTHIVKIPGDNKWHIRSYDWSWREGLMLYTAQVFAQEMGWQDLEFDTFDDAYAFVEQQIKKGKAPSKPNKRRSQ
jgi:hypothetical protein